MNYFTEQGATHMEVLDRINTKYGRRARILSKKSIRTGGFMGLFTREGVEYSGIVLNTAPSAQEDLQQEKSKILAQLRGKEGGGDSTDVSRRKKEEKEASATLRQVLEEIQEIKARVEKPVVEERHFSEHPTVQKMGELLIDNEFTPVYIEALLARLKRECTLEDLNDEVAVKARMRSWIEDSIETYQLRRDTRVLVLVGPTGVGKTTTIAKLAAIHSLAADQKEKRKVRMITIDTYRIGAKKQIETYANIMELAVTSVETPEEMKREIDSARPDEMILVDTIGKSPRDYMKLAQMREILEACGPDAEMHLAVSSTTKTRDIQEILLQFEPFRYRAVVLTKLDETTCAGNLISVLEERKKPISFITNGQVVPQDIERAQASTLLKMLKGF